MASRGYNQTFKAPLTLKPINPKPYTYEINLMLRVGGGDDNFCPSTPSQCPERPRFKV